MNRHRSAGSLKQAQTRIRQHWGSLGDDLFEVIGGKCDPLVGSIQESYDISEDEAEQLLEQSIRH